MNLNISDFLGSPGQRLAREEVVVGSARRYGKSIAAEVARLFMETPGVSSDNPQQMDELYQKALAKVQGHLHRDPLNQQEIRDIHMAIEDDELDEATELEAALADLAADLTARYARFGDHDPGLCTLLGPEQLTVEVSGRGYKKEAHMGGEEFVPQSAYLGKRRKIIVVFKPATAAAYTTMEMPADEAVTKLDNFEALSATDSGPYRARVRALALQASALKDRATAKTKVNDYQDFGSF